jgi:signal transduction histidine kinase
VIDNAPPSISRLVPRGFGSVRIRVTGLAVLVVFGSLLAGAFGLRALLERATLQSVRTDAQVRVAEVSALALRAELPVPLPNAVGTRPTLIQVVERNGTVSTATAPLLNRQPLLPLAELDGDHGRKMALVFDGAPSQWWVEAVPATLNGRAATVIVASSLAELRRTLNQLAFLLAIGIPMLTTAAGILVWVLVGRALYPVDRLRSEVDMLAADSQRRGQRVGVPDTDDEISRLAHTLNLLLDKLDKSAYSQRRFVADASHELRGPVANIRLAVEVAQAHPEQADWNAVANEVLIQDERMGRLVEHLLLLARTDDDHALRRTEALNLTDIAHEAAASNRRDGISVRVATTSTTVLHDDRSQLVSIVNNLVENAVRFAAHQVTISVMSTGGWVELSVRDDGPGVPADERERIFDRFYRVDAHRSREGGGTGLGLAIVARLVSERGGSVTVGDASPGSVFTVRLPLKPGLSGRSPLNTDSNALRTSLE